LGGQLDDGAGLVHAISMKHRRYSPVARGLRKRGDPSNAQSDRTTNRCDSPCPFLPTQFQNEPTASTTSIHGKDGVKPANQHLSHVPRECRHAAAVLLAPQHGNQHPQAGVAEIIGIL
jgi:hypothetical protein